MITTMIGAMNAVIMAGLASNGKILISGRVSTNAALKAIEVAEEFLQTITVRLKPQKPAVDNQSSCSGIGTASQRTVQKTLFGLS